MRSKVQKDLDQWRKKLKELSFEDSLRELDTLLSKLQNDEVPLADLQAHYLQGKAYLAHCQELLDSVEQELVEVNLNENNSS
ncbi:exodeoxyribonuclease VII small subunit [Prochlorococcus sp. MIT 1300]|uniref:exodeoxyribonuclease VII small subunit n=1 Tax=Prochlorococcus sp. MIT 1300 TaxID=3096218 RepID=UPI002A74CE62|nr:exodeoxyribonuclease VII small subunit [Prochlorococcus sp. MIT 1300]